MKKKVTLNVNDKIFNLDLITGSENENALDISKLRSDANLITLDSGFKNTGSCQSAITFLDGEKGILRYRGYSIEELANKADFLEVAYLLIFGELPTKSQLEKISDDIKERSIIDEDLRIILNSYPKSAHPMGILSSLTSGLVAFDPSAVDIDDEEDSNIEWTEILSQSAVQPHNQNLFDCQRTKIWSHIRLKIFPDGGVARFRVYGEAQVRKEQFIKGELIDLASVINGGRGVSASDMFFSSPSNLIMPNRGLNMGDGWETKRRRDDGNDWAVIKLGLPGTIRKVILDTAHFKGNYPDQFSLQAANSTNTDDKNLSWQTILEKTPLRADYEHLFIRQLLCAEDEQFTHIKVHIYPDGGISRLRIFGFPNWGAQ